MYPPPNGDVLVASRGMRKKRKKKQKNKKAKRTKKNVVYGDQQNKTVRKARKHKNEGKDQI